MVSRKVVAGEPWGSPDEGAEIFLADSFMAAALSSQSEQEQEV
jgi:hypothetical protein